MHGGGQATSPVTKKFLAPTGLDLAVDRLGATK
jgi:hypothetical protein